MFRIQKLPGRFKTKNKLLLSNMKSLSADQQLVAGINQQIIFSEKDALRLYRIQKSAVICPPTESRQHFRQRNRG